MNIEKTQATEKERLRGTLLIITATILWGINGNIGTFLFENKDVNADHLTMLRLLVSGIILLSYQLIKDRKELKRMLSFKNNIFILLYFTFFGLLALQYGYFQAVKYSNAATGTVLQSFAPFIIVALVSIRDRKLPSKRLSLALLLALSGAFLLVTHGRLDKLAINPKALFFGMVASLGSVGYNLAPGPLQMRYSTISIMSIAMFLSGGVFGLVTRPFQNPIIVDMASILGILYVIFIGTLIPFSIFLMGSKYVGPQRASILNLFEPVSATLVAVLVVGIKMEIEDYIGIGLVLAALILISRPEKEKKDM